MRFIKYWWVYFIISGSLILASIVSLAIFKLNLSVDFVGGVVWEIAIENDVSKEDFYLALGETLNSVEDTGNSYVLKLDYVVAEDKEAVAQKIFQLGNFEELRFESLGPSFGSELLRKTLIGVLIASLGILFYITLRFKDRGFGFCALVAMFHDSFILLGSFSIFGHYFNVEIDSLFVTAFLTILSFSVHDTVVVFDRIRENMKLHPKLEFPQVADLAISETLVRSVNNSLTIIFVLLSLFLLGGGSTRDFALALLVGTILGTYSSPFTAVPLLVFWKKKFN